MLISGFDTETYDGYVKLLTCTVYDTDTEKYEQYYIETFDSEVLLTFLYEHSLYSNYAVWYNINYDIASILKPYIVDNLKELREKFYKYIALNREYQALSNKIVKDKSDFTRLMTIEEQVNQNKPLDFKLKRFKVAIISGKSVSIKPLKRKAKKLYFFDVANFYKTSHDGFMTLDYAAQKYLGEKKNNQELEIDRKRIGTEKGYYEANREKIIKYGLQDSYLTAKLLYHTIQAYNNIGVNFPDKPYSKASISRQYLKDNYLAEYEESQKYYLMYDSVVDFKKFYNGGYFRVFAVGKFDNVVNRDIRSAYPYAISKLYSLSNAILVSYGEQDFNKADYTFYEIKANHNPLLQTRYANSIYYFEDDIPHTYFITGLDKEILDLYGVPYTVIKGYGLITTKKIIFSSFDNLYKNKNEIKKKYGGESAEYTNIKIVMNGFYGILAQSRPFITHYTNYVYASYITALCRNIILKELYVIDKEQEVIQISTDSIMYSEKTHKQYPTGDNLGDIEEERYDSAIVYGSGIYTYNKKGMISNRRRGFSDINLSKYSNITDSYIISEHSRPVHILESIIQQIPDNISNFKLERKIFNPVKALSEKYNIEDISSWCFLDFSMLNSKVKCYKSYEVIK